MQEGRVEADVEVFQLLVAELLRACELVEVFVFVVLHHLVHPLTEGIHLVDIHGAEAHEVAHVLLFHDVGLAQVVVGGGESGVEC